MDQKKHFGHKILWTKIFWTLIFWTKIFYPLFLLDPKFYESKNILDQFFLVRVEVEQKLKWITSKTFMTNSGPFKTALRLFQSCFKTIKDPQILFQANIKITTSYPQRQLQRLIQDYSRQDCSKTISKLFQDH